MSALPYTLHRGDCREVMAAMEAESIDAIVSDPPYGLSFMGREWDHGVPGVPFWAEALRVAKPGAHLVAFGGSRTFHRLVCAVEDAGWEVRDVLMWVYGSGFPKSLDVSKAIDNVGGYNPADVARTLWSRRELAGLSRQDVATAVGCSVASVRNWEEGRARRRGGAVENITPSPEYRARLADLLGYTADERARSGVAADRRGDGSTYGLGHSGVTTVGGQTDAARQWSGWGTALKPAYEPIILARKPLRGTVARNVQTFGTGAINVDGCRIAGESTRRTNSAEMGYHGGNVAPKYETGHIAGRWPSNILLDEAAAEVLDAQSGELSSGSRKAGEYGLMGYGVHGAVPMPEVNGDRGGASRFFYTSKASGEDRGRWQGNNHPTVKPTDLMRWLCRLVTPPGGIILDPFMGSGSTGVAAIEEGFHFVGIDIEQPHVDIAERRLKHATRQPSLFDAPQP